MSYHYQTGVFRTFLQEHLKLVVASSILALGVTIGISSLRTSAVVLPDCSTAYTTSGTTLTLTQDCETAQVWNLAAGQTLDGAGFTIYPEFSRTDNSNNAVIGIIDVDGVSIKNLTIEGVGGTSLHGINIYTADNVLIEDVTIANNDRSGIVVNGSQVTVRDITTLANTWHGINVDLGGGVTSPAVLTVVGTSTHSDILDIYVDNVAEAVTVNDVENQYTVSSNVLKAGDALYTRAYVASKDSCKDNGWKLGLSDGSTFKNQGDCVSYFASKMKNKPAGATTSVNARR